MTSFSGAGFTFPDDLPAITFADAGPAAILARLIKKFERDAAKTLYPGDPERLLLNAAAYEFSVAYSLLDFTGKQNLLAHGQEGFLDHIGAFHAVERLAPAPAKVVQRFFAEPGLSFAVPIPDTLRVSPDNAIFFKVTKAASIPPAASPTAIPFVDVIMECTEAGSAGNGFSPGQIGVLVDPRPHIALTFNISASSGGTDAESDDHFRHRVYLAPEGFSTAGPEGAYQFRTYSASSLIVDVAVLSPKPCDIEVYPLLSGGELPDEAMLALVAEKLSPRDVRPQGDRVSVKTPVTIAYAVEGVYYVSRNESGQVEAIRAAVEQAGIDYADWQKEKLGRDIVPDELVSRVRAAGAKRLVITSPAFTAVAENAVAVASAVNLMFGGFEDD